MTEDNRLSKIEILFQQQRYTEAEKILADMLREDADNAHYMALLAEAQLFQNEFNKAYSLINQAIGLAPEYPYLYHIKSRIAIQQDNYKEAELNIQQAIALDPEDADYFAILANIQLGRKQYEEALETANTALEIDSENILALNTRSTALNKLNRQDESFQTIQGALHEDPNNAFTHANYGWGLLERGNHEKALEHFKEALSNDPTMEYAQSGMIEAIKATNPIYRLFLKYYFFMSNLRGKYQWMIIIGFYIGFRALRNIAKNNEHLQPYLTPLIVIIALMAFSTWIMEPISNVFLRFHKYGQWLLDKKEKMSSNFVASSFVVFATSLVVYFFTSIEGILILAIYGFTMMLPLGTMFASSKNKYVLPIYTIALGVIGLAAVGISFSDGKWFNLMTIVFFIGFMGYQLLTNYILIKGNNH